MVRWQQIDGAGTAVLADRVLAARERRICVLPEQKRQQASYWAGELDRRGVIEAELAAPVPQPRTVVGAWLQALMLREQARHRDLSLQLNRGQRDWSEDEAAVAAAAFDLMLARVLAPGSPTVARESPNRYDFGNQWPLPRRREMI
jgi:hypothetical protein